MQKKKNLNKYKNDHAAEMSDKEIKIHCSAQQDQTKFNVIKGYCDKKYVNLG